MARTGDTEHDKNAHAFRLRQAEELMRSAGWRPADPGNPDGSWLPPADDGE